MRFIFVVGPPRTGTTMVGALLGSHRDVYCPGEYFGFYVAAAIVPNAIGRIPSTLREAYLVELRAHALSFAERASRSAGASVFCDATPWNLLIANTLARGTDALFVLCVRRPEGVVQSLARSYAAGFWWAGADVEQRAQLYCDFYVRVAQLPRERTIVFDYDRFCEEPAERTGALLRDVERALGVDGSFDHGVLVHPHAPAPGANVPIATRLPDGRIAYRPRASYDADAVTEEARSLILRIARPGLNALASRFPETVAGSLMEATA